MTRVVSASYKRCYFGLKVNNKIIMILTLIQTWLIFEQFMFTLYTYIGTGSVLQENERRAVLRIRIRIHMFLGLPNPDPLVSDTDPDSSIIKQIVLL